MQKRFNHNLDEIIVFSAQVSAVFLSFGCLAVCEVDVFFFHTYSITSHVVKLTNST